MHSASEEIHTQRLILRRARADDAAAMHGIMSNPVAMRFWSTPPHAKMADTDRWMASMIEADPEASDDYIVTLGGRLIGKLGAWRLPEIGFLLDPPVPRGQDHRHAPRPARCRMELLPRQFRPNAGGCGVYQHRPGGAPL